MITIDELKREMMDFLTGNVMNQFENILIDDIQLMEKLTEIEEIECMSDEEFYSWFELIRGEGLV